MSENIENRKNSYQSILNGTKLEIAYEYGKCDLLKEYLVSMPIRDVAPALENMLFFNRAAKEQNSHVPPVEVDENDGSLRFPACNGLRALIGPFKK